MPRRNRQAEPAPSTIAERAEQVRADWSEETEQGRAAQFLKAVRLPTLSA
jgi:hypothetical protein